MAVILAFSKFALLFVTAHLTSALNSPAPVVHTVSNVTLMSGKQATLTCKYNRTVFAVYWRYESTTSAMELLVVLDKHYEDGKRSGPGYKEGRFNITDDYSLIIREVKATDEGKFICEVSDYETGSVLRNHTDVTTVVIAEQPFIRIEQCEDGVSADEISEPCVHHTTSNDQSIQLTCTVLGAKPVVDLTWESSMSSEHWKQVMNTSTLTNKARTIAIFDQALTVTVDTSYIKSNKQHFTCVGKGLAVDGTTNYTIAVFPPEHAQGGKVTLAVVITAVCILSFTVVIIFVLLRLRKKRPSPKATMDTFEEKVNKLRDMKADEPVYLGVFGNEGAGKSSFIDSLILLIQENNASTRPQTRTYADEPNKIWEYTDVISEGLRIRKQRDFVPMITPEEIPSILLSNEKDNSSSRADINMEIGDLIHYPIFVFDISNKHDGDNRMELLRKLAEAVHDHILQYPMIVLTKASTTRKDLDEEKLIRKVIRKTKIPRENILVTFQFSASNDKIDELTRDEQLDFILKCAAKVDVQKKDIKTPLSAEEKSAMPLLSDTTF